MTTRRARREPPRPSQSPYKRDHAWRSVIMAGVCVHQKITALPRRARDCASPLRAWRGLSAWRGGPYGAYFFDGTHLHFERRVGAHGERDRRERHLGARLGGAVEGLHDPNIRQTVTAGGL